MTFDHDAFTREVYDIVRQIPAGRVLSYGRIAEWAGWPNHSRAVGRAMKEAPLELGLPCHRVVNSAGRTVPGWHQQAILLMSEGVRIRDNGCVDMKTFAWQPEAPSPSPYMKEGGVSKQAGNGERDNRVVLLKLLRSTR